MPYEWIKALHLISVMSWMAGMLYLPRLFVYHADAKPGSEFSEKLKVMEYRLLRFIITPAMIATLILGVWLVLMEPDILHHPFMHAKLGLVALMLGAHGFLSKCRRRFAEDRNTKPARFYRWINEVPTLLMIGIVILIIVRPGP
ncbi:MAG: protoporphyrinogen oxidase HemJ [Pseudomonadota bacterium]|nr:protoporphyrinogen oxidase HemJ [Pseudomonadota bacterium]